MILIIKQTYQYEWPKCPLKYMCLRQEEKCSPHPCPPPPSQNALRAALLTWTHSVFIIRHITEDVVEIENSSISMLQSMHLYPVVWILYERIDSKLASPKGNTTIYTRITSCHEKESTSSRISQLTEKSSGCLSLVESIFFFLWWSHSCMHVPLAQTPIHYCNRNCRNEQNSLHTEY